MFTAFFKKTAIAPPESFDQAFERKKQQQNETVKRLLQDFPWLWAISNYHSRDDAERIKISQDVADLKTVLALPSKKTSFSMWAITSQQCEVFNVRATCLTPLDNKMWAEAIMLQTVYFSSVLYLVKVDSCSEYSQYKTIFRQPGKTPLNGLIQDVVELHGGRVCWQIPTGIE